MKLAAAEAGPPRGEQRTGFDYEGAAGDLIDARGYAHAVHRREFERAQDEQIQSAL